MRKKKWQTRCPMDKMYKTMIKKKNFFKKRNKN